MSAQPEFVVVELRVDASKGTQGSAEWVAALDKAARASDAMSVSANKAQAAITSQNTAMTQAAAANENLAKGSRAANDNYNEFGKSVAERAGDFLTNVTHLKLMATAAYAISPAFRSIVSSGIVATFSTLGAAAPAAATALTTVARVLAPMLSFFSAIAVPIFAVVGAWKALNYVIGIGSDLLEKYGNSGRALFGKDVDENLKKLTEHQNETLLPQQVKYATELGNRLIDAKRTINEFMMVSVDLTGPALFLQSI